MHFSLKEETGSESINGHGAGRYGLSIENESHSKKVKAADDSYRRWTINSISLNEELPVLTKQNNSFSEVLERGNRITCEFKGTM